MRLMGGRSCCATTRCIGTIASLQPASLFANLSKLFVDSANDNDEPNGHPFAGYYFPYPDANYEGLVSTIVEEPPILNWIYVDKDTYQVKYGVRADAQPHLTGPFDCTRQDRRLTLEGWEGFAAVEEEEGVWALYYDRDDDGLEGKVEGKKVLEIELTRKEKRWRRNREMREADQASSSKVQVKTETNTQTQQTQE